MIDSIKAFWIDSYQSHKLAFYCEMISAIAVLNGSMILTYTVLDPRPDLFLPVYFVASTTGFVGAYYRKSAWVMVLTFWFTIMNTIGLWRLFL